MNKYELYVTAGTYNKNKLYNFTYYNFTLQSPNGEHIVLAVISFCEVLFIGKILVILVILAVQNFIV